MAAKIIRLAGNSRLGADGAFTSLGNSYRRVCVEPAADHRSEIESWRATLAESERARMNHPTTLRRRYDAAHKVAAKDPNAPKKETSREALVRENEDLWAKIKKLERQVEAGDGSLFDLRRDSIESIVNVVAGNVPLGRFQSLQRAMTEKLAKLKAEDKNKQAKAG
jgi:hypothetical protein